MKNITVLVCGGRDFSDEDFVFKILNEIHKEHIIELIIQGEASGADFLAKKFSLENNIKLLSVPAEWNKYGPAAGPKRNEQMLNENPNLVVAFPGGKGTKDMVRKSLAKKTKTIEFFVFEGEIKTKIHNG